MTVFRDPPESIPHLDRLIGKKIYCIRDNEWHTLVEYKFFGIGSQIVLKVKIDNFPVTWWYFVHDFDLPSNYSSSCRWQEVGF